MSERIVFCSSAATSSMSFEELGKAPGLPEAEIEPTFQENLGAALALINCAGFDAPAKKITITWTPDTTVAQVVRSCWKVFEGFTP